MTSTGAPRPGTPDAAGASGQANPVLEAVVRHLVVGPAYALLTRAKVTGRDHIPPLGQAAIIASNHHSFSDSIVIPLAAGRPVSFLGKAEYFQGRGVRGALMRAWFSSFGTIPVERDDARAAVESLRLAAQVLGEGGAFGIYPEGTRSRDGRLYRGRTGVARLALRTGAPIIPCALTGTGVLHPPDRRLPRPARVTVTFGPPIDLTALRQTHQKAALLRAITDATMDAIGAMSGQERSGRYASDVNAESDAEAGRAPETGGPGR